jgi:hypothetical protein
MTPDELPTDARKKLVAIEAARMDAEDAMQSAGRRLQQLNPRSTDPAIGEALQEKRDKHGQRFEELSALMNKTRQWLRTLPPGTVLEAVPSVHAKPNAGETIVSAVARIRREIQTCKKDLADARNAPLPIADAKQLVAARAQKMAVRADPPVDVTAGKLTMQFDDSPVTHRQLVQILARVIPEQTTQWLGSGIDGEPPENPLTAQEKEKRIEQLTARLNELEKTETSLIDLGREQNIEIAYRADISPACVLGVIIKTAAQAEAAAA